MKAKESEGGPPIKNPRWVLKNQKRFRRGIRFLYILRMQGFGQTLRSLGTPLGPDSPHRPATLQILFTVASPDDPLSLLKKQKH